MGDRAHCVIVERGEATIHLGLGIGATLPSYVLVDALEEWRNVEGWFAYPADSLYWTPGGLLVDRDQRRLLFWGGEDICYRPYLRRPLLAALRALCPAWSIDWAMHGNADLQAALPRGQSNVQEDDLDFDSAQGFDPAHPTNDEKLFGDYDYTNTLITIRWQDGAVSDYILGDLPGMVLAIGPRLCDLLAKKRPSALPHERDEEFAGGALLDVVTQQLWVWDPSTLDPRYLAALERLWTGWRVAGHVEGMARQVSLSGRDPAPIMVPYEECATRLLKVLGPVTFSGYLTEAEQHYIVRQIMRPAGRID
ncbi:hypothetical protein [Dictyobacter aurantiacus]|uniref:Uncharacterized protein n=1 Tax=Dictyobacter aurantiacus TaxID=1936993 RepID=A0A401ZJP1_9CHLR|nr:hypothetical protein [Dictyobacter aurantiacus]GCE07085.1 hypothetical protein KDAU_44140 [Dictyobacter aurantiacus]